MLKVQLYNTHFAYLINVPSYCIIYFFCFIGMLIMIKSTRLRLNKQSAKTGLKFICNVAQRIDLVLKIGFYSMKKTEKQQTNNDVAKL